MLAREELVPELVASRARKTKPNPKLKSKKPKAPPLRQLKANNKLLKSLPLKNRAQAREDKVKEDTVKEDTEKEDKAKEDKANVDKVKEDTEEAVVDTEETDKEETDKEETGKEEIDKEVTNPKVKEETTVASKVIRLRSTLKMSQLSPSWAKINRDYDETKKSHKEVLRGWNSLFWTVL